MPAMPWMKTLTLTGGTDNLLGLMVAVDKGAPPRACKLLIVLDPGSSSDTVVIGNDDVGSANFGYQLSSTAPPFNIENADEDLINLSQIFLIGSAGSMKVDVTVLTK